MFEKLLSDSNESTLIKDSAKIVSKDSQTEEHAGRNNNTEDEVDISSISRDEFKQLFRRPKNGSILMKMKSGDLSGKASSGQWENLLSEIILVGQAKTINTSLYAVCRMVMGHNSAAMFAENAQSLITAGKAPNEEYFLPYIMGEGIDKWDDVGGFLKGLLPFHKDIIMNHAGLFKKLAGF